MRLEFIYWYPLKDANLSIYRYIHPHIYVLNSMVEKGASNSIVRNKNQLLWNVWTVQPYIHTNTHIYIYIYTTRFYRRHLADRGECSCVGCGNDGVVMLNSDAVRPSANNCVTMMLLNIYRQAVNQFSYLLSVGGGGREICHNTILSNPIGFDFI